jgi:flagellar hook-length control protein FliK
VIAAAAAPAVIDPQATASPAAGAATGGTGFDAILMLQGLAGTADSLEGTLEPGDALASEDGGEDETDDDIEASLAFLANLIAATTAPGSNNDSGAGAGGQGADADADSALPLALEADAGVALPARAGEPASAATDTEAAAALSAVTPEPLESRQSAGDASQNLARAVELLTQSPRSVALDRATHSTPVHRSRWADDFGARISLMVRAGESTASLQLTPVDLGPVEVSVSVKDSQATIHFGATQADTRALIEASLPRLRELLASQGFNLLDASVSSGFNRSQQPAPSRNDHSPGEPDVSTTDVERPRRLGLLDLYA